MTNTERTSRLSLNRRELFSVPALGALSIAASPPLPAKEQGVGELYSLKVCPATPENPRHDHTQIFPLKDGRLLLAWSEYYVTRPSQILLHPYDSDKSSDETPCRISGRISTDQGRSWSGKITLQENIGLRNVKQSNLVRLSSDEILFFFTVWNSRTDDRRIYLKRSKDECETWTQPEQFSKTGGFYVLDSGRAFVHSSGRIILPAYWSPWTRKEEKEHFKAFCFYSDDQGRTWRESKNRIDLPKRGAMEPAMVELKDGSLFTVLRNVLGKLYTCLSPDGGETWREPKATALNAPQSQPCLKRIPKTGDLLVIWNHTLPYALTEPGSTNFGQPRDPLSCAISRDEGQTWENIKNIEKREGYDSAYPNVEFLREEALVTYYQNSRATKAKRELMLKIFDVNWFYT